MAELSLWQIRSLKYMIDHIDRVDGFVIAFMFQDEDGEKKVARTQTGSFDDQAELIGRLSEQLNEVVSDHSMQVLQRLGVIIDQCKDEIANCRRLIEIMNGGARP
jgi:hypothetical protein